jgi:hypothetical protein
MTATGGINIILAVREHIDAEIKAARAEIEETERKLADQRTELHALLAIREAAGVQDVKGTALKIETGAPVVAEDARASSETDATSAPAPIAA